jgi:hypothetical protein
VQQHVSEWITIIYSSLYILANGKLTKSRSAEQKDLKKGNASQERRIVVVYGPARQLLKLSPSLFKYSLNLITRQVKDVYKAYVVFMNIVQAYIPLIKNYDKNDYLVDCYIIYKSHGSL